MNFPHKHFYAAENYMSTERSKIEATQPKKANKEAGLSGRRGEKTFPR